MIKKFSIGMQAILVGGLMFTSSAFAAKKGSPSLSSQTSSSAIGLPKEGGIIVGPRLGLGAIGGAGLGFLLAGEYKLAKQFGVGAVLGYSSYSQGYYAGNWNYSNILIMAQGTFHLNEWIKVKSMDFYANLLLGYNVASVNWGGNSPYAGSYPAYGGVAVGFGANARYFVSKNFAVSGGIGYGMGLLNLGVDYQI